MQKSLNVTLAIVVSTILCAAAHGQVGGGAPKPMTAKVEMITQSSESGGGGFSTFTPGNTISAVFDYEFHNSDPTTHGWIASCIYRDASDVIVETYTLLGTLSANATTTFAMQTDYDVPAYYPLFTYWAHARAKMNGLEGTADAHWFKK